MARKRKRVVYLDAYMLFILKKEVNKIISNITQLFRNNQTISSLARSCTEKMQFF
jgi:hypothetical protein